MSTRPHHTIAQQLNAGQLAISNSLSDPEIQSLVAQFGYPAEKLNEGKALYDCALSAVNCRKGRGGQRSRNPPALLEGAEKSARDAYQALAKVARAVVRQGQGSTQRARFERNHAQGHCRIPRLGLHPV